MRFTYDGQADCAYITDCTFNHKFTDNPDFVTTRAKGDLINIDYHKDLTIHGVEIVNFSDNQYNPLDIPVPFRFVLHEVRKGLRWDPQRG